MRKRDLIASLEQFASRKGDNSPNWKGQRVFAKFFIHYLGKLHIPNDEKYDFYQIEPHLPELAVDAFEQLRASDDGEVVRFRREYESEVGQEVPNLTDLGASNILDQTLTVQAILGYTLRDVTGVGWIEHKIDAYCNAQKYVLQQTFDKFLRSVYRQGLAEIVDKCNKSGMSGKFGETELRTFVTAGRIMFTFARRIDREKSGYYEEEGKLFCNEWNVSFVGEDGDPLCLSAGIQSVYADFRTALDMIEDVIKQWPPDSKEQEMLYRADTDVSML
jgi:hypothetical protein